MADLNKTIRKIAGRQRNALAVYIDEELLSSVSEDFDTVFALSFYMSVRKRNIVYREKLENLETLSEIGVVLLNKDNLSALYEMPQLFLNTRAPLIIFTSEFIDTDFAKLLKRYKYELVDIRKQFQLWTFKK